MGPMGQQSVYAMFIPWQADDDYAPRGYYRSNAAKEQGGPIRYVVVDPLARDKDKWRFKPVEWNRLLYMVTKRDRLLVVIKIVIVI